MLISDRIYGPQEIDEPIILELLASPFLERLKGVDQYGHFEAFFSGTASSRYDHSLGVFFLLRRYGASLAEQVSGLVHDVSHTVFSHCIDYLDGGDQKDQSYQDTSLSTFLAQSDLPAILNKYGYALEYILDDHNFPLKEQSLPDLCADRIDYSLRDANKFIGLTPTEIQNILADLSVADGRWIFKNQASAKNYAQIFFEVNQNYYCGLPSAVMLNSVGNYLNYALSKKYIRPDDLYTTDQAVLKKINNFLAVDPALEKLFQRLDNKVSYVNNPADYDFLVFCKSRVVDPLFYDAGVVRRLSEADPVWKLTLAAERPPKKYFLKFSS